MTLRKSAISRKTGLWRYPTSKRAPKGKKPKIKSISKLMKEADAFFSKQVRMTGAFKLEGSEEWHNLCYTCRKIFPVKKLHAGHYLSRFYKSARWDTDNCRPQCMMDNLWKRGDPIVFRQNLVEEIGLERVLAVEAKRREMVKLTREYLQELINSLEKNV